MKKILLTALIVMGELGVFFIGLPQNLLADVDVSAIVLGICGNNLVEPFEQCDGQALNHTSCSSLGYATGTLSCASSCSFDVEMCIPFPTTATSSEPVYDSQGRALETITTYSNPNYPKKEEEVVIPQSPDQGQNSSQTSGTGGSSSGGSSSQSPNTSAENINQNRNTSDQSYVDTESSSATPEPLSIPKLVIVTTYWIGVNSLILLAANIKKVWTLLILTIGELLRLK